MTSSRCIDRRGMALLVVVVLTMLIALAAYRFSFYMESQYRLTRLHEEQVQAKLASLSGVELAASLVELPVSERSVLGGLENNPTILKHVSISSSAESNAASQLQQTSSEWRFGLISPNVSGSSEIDFTRDQSADIRFGLENESAKIHLPTLIEIDRKQPGHARATLLNLPYATETLVDAWLQQLGVLNQRAASGSNLLDRLQANSTNASLPSEIDQLKIRWYGGDLNQNYRLDPLENRIAGQLLESLDTSSSTGAAQTSSESTPTLAWQRFVTWESGQRNESAIGQPRINLNEPNLAILYQQLSTVWPADWANFVIAMRQYGPTSSAAGATAANPVAGDAGQVESPIPDLTKPAAYTFKSVLDVVGAVVQTLAPNGDVSSQTNSAGVNSNNASSKKQTLRNPFSSDLSSLRNYLGKLLDEATVDSQPYSVGRIDVSTAPAVVLTSVPGIDIALAQRIVQLRNTLTEPTRESPDSIAWLLDNGTVDLVKLKAIEPYLTHRNDVYTVQSVGYRDQLSPVYRCTVTIDARQIPARIIHHQIWHPWDRGFMLDQLNSSSP